MLRNIYLVAFVTHIQSLLRFAGLRWCVGFAGRKLARRTGKRTMHRPLGKALGFRIYGFFVHFSIADNRFAGIVSYVLMLLPSYKINPKPCTIPV